MPQFDVLAELARAPEQGFTFVELSRLLLVTSGNLTGIIDRLEDEGLVKREPELSDRRVTRMRLTPAGRRRMEEILPLHAADVGQMLSVMPASDSRSSTNSWANCGTGSTHATRRPSRR